MERYLNPVLLLTLVTATMLSLGVGTLDVEVFAALRDWFAGSPTPQAQGLGISRRPAATSM